MAQSGNTPILVTNVKMDDNITGDDDIDKIRDRYANDPLGYVKVFGILGIDKNLE